MSVSLTTTPISTRIPTENHQEPENILYQKLVIRGMEVSSSEELKDVVPDVFVDVISSKVKVDRIEAEVGRYLYIAKKDDLIYIWSVSL
jgi:hypothetical protein